jgi:hypothetical protein
MLNTIIEVVMSEMYDNNSSNSISDIKQEDGSFGSSSDSEDPIINKLNKKLQCKTTGVPNQMHTKKPSDKVNSKRA